MLYTSIRLSLDTEFSVVQMRYRLLKKCWHDELVLSTWQKLQSSERWVSGHACRGDQDEVRRTAHYGHHHSLAGILHCISGGKELSSSIRLPPSASGLWLWYYHIIKALALWSSFPTTMDCSLKLWASISHLFLKLFLSENFITIRKLKTVVFSEKYFLFCLFFFFYRLRISHTHVICFDQVCPLIPSFQISSL